LVTEGVLDCKHIKNNKFQMKLNTRKRKLQPNTEYNVCVSILKESVMVPACSGHLQFSDVSIPLGKLNQERPDIRGLHAKMVTNQDTVEVSLKVSLNQKEKFCQLKVSVKSVFDAENECLADRVVACDTTLTTLRFRNAQPEPFYNICASVISSGEDKGDDVIKDYQCMLSSPASVRYETKPVLPLLLTLVFLGLGIACLTVLYLIVRRKSRKRRPVGANYHSPCKKVLLCINWKLQSLMKGGKEGILIDTDDDEN